MLIIALFQTIRKLSEDQEEAEKLNMDEKTKSFQHELELAQDELERLREDRNRQMTLVETIVRQRDMYRVLLAQNPEVSQSATFFCFFFIRTLS